MVATMFSSTLIGQAAHAERASRQQNQEENQLGVLRVCTHDATETEQRCSYGYARLPMGDHARLRRR